MLKKITVVYLPGYAGNFLEALFSLDSATVPLWNIGDQEDTPDARADSYLEQRKNKKMMHMGDHSLKQISPQRTNYNYMLESIHPEEFDYKKSVDQILVVDLDWSNFSNYWLVESKKKFDYQLARLRVGEIRKNFRIKKSFGIQTIDLNKFFDQSQWKTEYQRINLFLGLSDHISAADKLYAYWFDLRVREYVDNFANLSSDQYSYYCKNRLQEEINGTPTAWQIFYERTRDLQWPDCEKEEDFNNLPEWIQQELINVHGYQAQKPT